MGEPANSPPKAHQDIITYYKLKRIVYE